MSTQAMATAGAQPAGGERTAVRGGLTAIDYMTLFLIGLVVVLVSLPRLRRFALRENELDALALIEALGSDMSELGESLPEGGIAALLAANPRHENRFEDLELLEGGELRRHGYVFDAVELAHGQWALRGWPWEHGHTGLGAFVYSPTRGLLGHANSDGGWDGPGRAPDALQALSLGSGWRTLAR